jgi:uroporphyrinogen decarboxylase
LLHICGDTTKILAIMAETGANILELDHKVSLAEARDVVGERVCLMGNVDPAGVLLQGSADLVAEKCLEAINSAGQHGHFILGSGCEVPPKTPAVNMHAMINTAHTLRYPMTSLDRML